MKKEETYESYALFIHTLSLALMGKITKDDTKLVEWCKSVNADLDEAKKILETVHVNSSIYLGLRCGYNDGAIPFDEKPFGGLCDAFESNREIHLSMLIEVYGLMIQEG